MDPPDPTTYLQSLLNRQLRVHTTDTRMFVGDFKCTDKDLNIILARTFEYRHPSASAVNSAVASALSTTEPKEDTLKLDMTSRFLGLVVVPGLHITKIELEERGKQEEAEEAGSQEKTV